MEAGCHDDMTSQHSHGIARTVKELIGDEEIRTNDIHPDPFPLYPHEKLEGKIEMTSVILVHTTFLNEALIAIFGIDLRGDRNKLNE